MIIAVLFSALMTPQVLPSGMVPCYKHRHPSSHTLRCEVSTTATQTPWQRATVCGELHTSTSQMKENAVPGCASIPIPAVRLTDSLTPWCKGFDCKKEQIPLPWRASRGRNYDCNKAGKISPQSKINCPPWEQAKGSAALLRYHLWMAIREHGSSHWDQPQERWWLQERP